MAAPGIELRRHESITPEQWELVRPKLREASAWALEVAYEYGMELHDTKYAYFHAARPRYPALAEAPTAKTTHWYAGPGMLAGKVDVGFIAHKMLHELVHQEREELVVTDTVGSLAATEGVAYNIEALSRNEGYITTWNYPQPRVVELVARMDRTELTQLYNELGKDMHEPIYDDIMLKKWWHVKRQLGIRMIDVVGIAAVQHQINQGYEGAEIWQLPTLDVLGYEEAV